MSELPVITVSEAARKVILEMRSAEADGDALALRIDVTGVGAGGQEFAYELMFEPAAEATADDWLGHSGDLAVLVPAESIDKLQGATLDHGDATGLVIRNPNRPTAPGPVALEGSIAEQVATLLDAEINPSLAAHGGFATLVGVEEDVVHITMGGGCQGCGLASVTLSEGIKAQILERIPEVREVVDVTNHAAGENPFFASH